MKIVIISETSPSPNLIQVAAKLRNEHFVTILANDTKVDRAAGLYQRPESVSLYGQVLESHDLVIYWVDDAKVLDKLFGNANGDTLGLIPMLFVIMLDDLPTYPENIFTNSLGIVVPNRELGAKLDGLTFGDITIIEQKTPDATATAISHAAELALARRPYQELTTALVFRLSQPQLKFRGTENNIILERATNYAFELFELA